MSQIPERKSRFQLSQDIQEDFVNGIAQTMLSLTQKVQSSTEALVGTPFCPTTGREYGGPNMLRLMLTSIEKGYRDDRWLTFKQIQQYQDEHPEQNVGIKKGLHGVRLLRPEELFFTVAEDGKWKFHSQDEARDIETQRKQGADLLPVQHKTLFYPFTVFNAEQLYGLPAKEQPAKSLSESERNAFLERFITASGVAVKHHIGPASYSPAEDMVKMPFPDSFASSGDYYAAKLREYYSGTGHTSRENRQNKSETLKSCAFEEMRGEMFSLLAGARFHLPMPENSAASQIAHWNQKFSGGDAKELFQAATDAAKILTALRQFEAGEKPTMWWFPKAEAWPELMEIQQQRDAVSGVSFRVDAFPGAPRLTPASSMQASLAESTKAFEATDDLTRKVRLILQNPDFLDMALRQDPEAIKDLASLCEQVSRVLKALDERFQPAPGAVENASPLNEQKAASAQRMRM